MAVENIYELRVLLEQLAGGRPIGDLIANRATRDSDPTTAQAMAAIGDYIIQPVAPGSVSLDDVAAVQALVEARTQREQEVSTMWLQVAGPTSLASMAIDASVEYAGSDERALRDLRVDAGEVRESRHRLTVALSEQLDAAEALRVQLAEAQAALEASNAQVAALAAANADITAQLGVAAGERDEARVQLASAQEELVAATAGNAALLEQNGTLAGEVAAYEEAGRMLDRQAQLAAFDHEAPAPEGLPAGALLEAQEAAREARASLLFDRALQGAVNDGIASAMAEPREPDALSMRLLDEAIANAQVRAGAGADTASGPSLGAQPGADALPVVPGEDTPVATSEAPQAPAAAEAPTVTASSMDAPVVPNLIDLAAIDAQVAELGLGHEAQQRVARMQAVLGVVGLDAQVDGLMGPQTRSGIAALDEARIAELSVDDRAAVQTVLAGVRDIGFTRQANREVPALVDAATGRIEAVQAAEAATPAPAAETTAAAAPAPAAVAHDPEAPQEPSGAVQAGLPNVGQEPVPARFGGGR